MYRYRVLFYFFINFKFIIINYSEKQVKSKHKMYYSFVYFNSIWY
jgi:hypothetical protein